jgi:hypothetical protein
MNTTEHEVLEVRPSSGGESKSIFMDMDLNDIWECIMQRHDPSMGKCHRHGPSMEKMSSTWPADEANVICMSI